MGIYVHIPFCLSKCSYCDFYSLPTDDAELFDQYSSCLVEELTRRAADYRLPFASIYLGGGTPSLLAPKHIERIIDTIYKCYQAGNDPEITLEVNPATVDRQDLEDFRRVGINRLSIGVQSFINRELKILGRMHDSQQASQCIDWSHQAGFDNVSVDLIYGIPGQNKEDWLASLIQAVNHEPQHISTYLLQLEPDVPLARRIVSGALAMLNDKEESDLYYLARDYLLEADYQHYELSNYAHRDRKSQHNMGYWGVCPYLGVGVGAVSFDGRQRSMNSPPLVEYLIALSHSVLPRRQILETMGRREQLSEALVMGLRLMEGIEPGALCRRFGKDIWRPFQVTIDRLASQGLLVVEPDRVYLPPQVYFISNAVFREFVE